MPPSRARVALGSALAALLLVACGHGPTDTVLQDDASGSSASAAPGVEGSAQPSPTDPPPPVPSRTTGTGAGTAGTSRTGSTGSTDATDGTDATGGAGSTGGTGGSAERDGGAGDGGTAAPGAPAPRAPAPSRAPGATTPQTSAPTAAPTVTTPPGGVPWNDFAFDPGRHSYAVTQNGIAFTVTVDDVQPKAGHPVRITLRSHSTEPGCCVLHADFADGGTASRERGHDCDTAPSEDNTLSVEHAWNRAGTYQAWFQAAPLCSIDAAPDALIRIIVKVGPGLPPVGNGPGEPTVTLAYSRVPQGDGSIAIAGTGRDEDGYVRRFVVDWGDGTAPEPFSAGSGTCAAGPSGLAGPSIGTVDDGSRPRTHRYVARGSYVVTLTVVSTDCAGGLEQTASATMPTGW